MHNSTQRVCVLKMEKPPFTIRCVYQSTLMGSVYFCTTLFQHFSTLVGAIHITGSQNSLPAGGYSSFRDTQIIRPIYFMNLSPFCSRSFIYYYTLIQKLCTIIVHFMNYDWSSP